MAVLSSEKVISSYVPLPICMINQQGKVLSASDRINEVFIYDEIVDSDIFTLTGIKAVDLYEAAESAQYPVIKRNQKIFKMVPHKINENGEELLAVLFNDVTAFEELKERYNEERMCLAKIQVDNYDELIADMTAQERQSLTNAIDNIIRKWAGRANASVNEMDNNIYLVAFEQHFLDRIIELKFNILDEVRDLETGADFPASLSIGVGAGGKNPHETEEYADAALDLALGRGGDQAVVKQNRRIEYFGGTLQTVEKRNKGKSRIVGHALKQLIDQSKKIFIMGHKNPDMDCFGAALGIARLCSLREVEPYIVIDNYKDALQVIFKQARDSDEYRFINSEKAKALADKDSLMIVLDTHRPSMVECPELLDICERVVVIDHHRRVEDFIENPVLAYMESYASSTCELVTEILQYMISKKALIKLEAEALLAGMTIDTNGFTVKAGVRTFEAAAWLRRQGADPTEVRRFFQEEMESFSIRARALAEAHFYEEGVVVSVCGKSHPDEQVICAQVADQLLNVRGVKASFVAGVNGEGRTVISARSLGEVNVQTVMEKFNGGGHLTTAAAQVDITPGEVIRKVLEIMEVRQ